MKLIISLFSLLFIFASCSKDNRAPLNILILDNNGVSGVSAKTSYKINSIAPYFLGYDIETFTAFQNAKPINAMRVSYNSHEIMLIIPEQTTDGISTPKVQSIIVTSDYVKNPFRLKIGDSYKENMFSQCTQTEKERICIENKFENIKIIFTKKTDTLYTFQEFIWSRNANNL
jgi:hypothetical protein